jgi:hypothetical protein
MSGGHDPGDGDGGSKSPDVVLVGGPSEDGQGVSILRVRDDRVEAGELRPAAEGKPIVGELVKLTPREEHQRLFDVEVLARGPRATSTDARAPRSVPHKGPPRVASSSYRSGWERIFGSPPELDEAADDAALSKKPLTKTDLN